MKMWEKENLSVGKKTFLRNFPFACIRFDRKRLRNDFTALHTVLGKEMLTNLYSTRLDTIQKIPKLHLQPVIKNQNLCKNEIIQFSKSSGCIKCFVYILQLLE